MSDFEMKSSDSEMDDEDIELQEAFAAGLIKPGLNTVHEAAKTYVNNVTRMRQKLAEIKLKLPWIELLDSVNKEAPLAPELAAKLLTHEQKRENQLKNNKKLPQLAPSDDPVINDFKREMMFHRQAQATVLETLPRLKQMGIATIRPDDYFAEMAKTDKHMQRIRQNLMQKQEQQKMRERMKQLRSQRKEGKAIQVQARLKRQQEKKDILDKVKKVRKGVSNDLSFLDGKKKGGGVRGGDGRKGGGGGGKMNVNRKVLERRKVRDDKFGFGGKKRGMKTNTRDSAEDISEFRRPKQGGKFGGKGRGKKVANKRPGKNRRAQGKARGKK